MYLHRLAQRHGNDWPTAALDRLLWLHSAQAWGCQDLADEYQTLLAWARQAVEAGIAFQQHAEQ